VKKTFPLFLGIIVSLIWFGEFFMSNLFYENWKTFFTNGFLIIGAIGMLVGFYSIYQVNYQRIRYNQDRWYSVIQVTMIAVMIAVAIKDGTTPSTPFDSLFMFAFVPLEATVFALLAFYISSAAFRSFRAKNVESILLLLAATFVMLGKIPLGENISDSIPMVSEWLMDGPTSAGRRAIMFGAALGGLTMMIRVFFCLEKSHLSDK